MRSLVHLYFWNKRSQEKLIGFKENLCKDKTFDRNFENEKYLFCSQLNYLSILCFSSHHRFRECVLDRTRNTCDPEAGPFSRQILDKALSFLKDQCVNYE